MVVSANTFGSSYATLLSVFRGSCTTLLSLTCNDRVPFVSGQSRVVFTVIGGGTYYFMVSAPLGDGGTLHFQLTS